MTATRPFFIVFGFILATCAALTPTFADDIPALTWNDCLREASRNNPDLISAQESVVQSQSLRSIAEAGNLPSVTGQLDANTSDSDSRGSTRSFSYGLTASQLLFDGQKTSGSIRSARENVEAARYGYRFTSAEVRYRLRQAFIDLLKAQDMLGLTEEIYQLRRNNLELIALRYESGTEHKGAYLTAKANLSQAAFEINAARRALVEAQRALNKEIGRDEFFPLRVASDWSLPEIQQDPLFDDLAARHPSFLRIIAQKNSAAFEVQARRGAFWPTIQLNANASRTDESWPPDENGTGAGVGVSVPLFSGGQNAARLSQARSVYRQIEQQERSTKDALVLDLQKNWNAFIDAVERLDVQNDFLAAAEERAKISQAQYSVGRITFDNWTIIEDDLVNSRKRLLDVRAAALLAEALWVRSQGETLEYEN